MYNSTEISLYHWDYWMFLVTQISDRLKKYWILGETLKRSKIYNSLEKALELGEKL